MQASSDFARTCLTEQGARAEAGMSRCIASPTIAMPSEPRCGGSCHPLKSALFVVVAAVRMHQHLGQGPRSALPMKADTLCCQTVEDAQCARETELRFIQAQDRAGRAIKGEDGAHGRRRWRQPLLNGPGLVHL